MALGVDIENLRYSVKDLLTGAMTDLHYLCWDKGDSLKILPANASLKDVEPDLLRSVDGRLRLKQHLQFILDQFDFIIIDTPPTLGIFTQAPLVASTEILVVLENNNGFLTQLLVEGLPLCRFLPESLSA